MSKKNYLKRLLMRPTRKSTRGLAVAAWGYISKTVSVTVTADVATSR